MNNVVVAEPYCGLPPVPAELWARWNLDPALVLVLLALAATHLLLARQQLVKQSVRSLRWWASGWIALSIGLISPLCALSVALFSARVTQHMFITMVAVPLLAAATRARTLRVAGSAPLSAAALFGGALWAWHLPSLYEWTFRSDFAYWAMHGSLAATAWLLWHQLLARNQSGLARVAAGFVTLVQMGLLGALITFAPRALYPVHALTSLPWGFTALEDQQLGGVIMWIPASLSLLAVTLWIVYQALQREGDAAPATGHLLARSH